MLYCMNYVEKEPTHYEPALSLVFLNFSSTFLVCVFWGGVGVIKSGMTFTFILREACTASNRAALPLPG